MPRDRFLEKRILMIESQVKARGVTHPRVLEALLQTPREKFVPEDLAANAYEDRPLPIGKNQTISQPYMVALMTQCLDPRRDDVVLEIGTGSGYQSALLSQLVAKVYTIEKIPALAEKAQKLLKDLGYSNVIVLNRDGTEGAGEYGPFDKIIITAGAPYLPKPLMLQLKNNGIMVIPIGDGYTQTLKKITKVNDSIVDEDICGCVFVPLVGKYGWKTKDTDGK